MADNTGHVLRETLTTATFVEIVDTLVSDFDVIEVLTLLSSRCVEILGAAAAGILLADSSGQLRVIGASSEQIEILELFQIQNDDGPCLECFHSGRVVLNGDLRSGARWPAFAAESVAAGFPSVCAVPLRLNALTLGCLNLFLAEPTPLSPQDVALAQALGDVASIAIVQDRATREAALREGQLQRALDSRIAIEQAKGMIAERNAVGMDEAFARLRAFARDSNRGLTEVAEAFVAGTIPLNSLSAVGRPPSAGSRGNPPIR
jgi:GAF domain-containing protein